MEALDWAGIITAVTALLTAIGLGCRWLIRFITDQANSVNDMLKAENATLKDRIEILEIKLDARNRGPS